METTDQEQKEETALKIGSSPPDAWLSLVTGETASDVEKSAMSLLTQPNHVNGKRKTFGREKLHFVIADLEHF